MASKASVSREQIVRAAYDRARAEGLASLSVRSVAKDCGVAVGTLYNYFPDKAALVTEVIERFWITTAFAGSEGAGDPRDAGQPPCFSYREGENLVAFCRRAYAELAEALAAFRSGWLAEASALDARTRSRGHRAEQACFGHICRNLERVIREDPGIDPAALERLPAEELARFTWSSMYGSLREERPDCEVLLALLERALYRRDDPDAACRQR